MILLLPLVIIFQIIPTRKKSNIAGLKGVELKTLEAAAKESYLPMRLHAADKVEEGLTSVEEVLRVII